MPPHTHNSSSSSTIERLCADALVDAERRIEERIAGRITPALGEQLAALLEDTVDGRITRFVWLRQLRLARTPPLPIV
jgi:hypothetical protein